MMHRFLLCLCLAFSGPALAAAAITLSANGDPAGPVTVEVGDTVYIEVTAVGCTDVNSNNRAWRDTWANAGNPAQQIFSASPCSDSPFGRTVSFSATGTYTVSFSSEYCRNYRFGDCRTGWVADGTDEIVIVVRDPLVLTCFADEFTGSTLNPEDWVTSVSRGSFTPGIADNGRLRMTQAISNQATAATLQRLIPGAENLVILEFDYFAYGGNGADGLAIALSDAAVTPQPGSYGGSLGYAQRSNGDPGFAGGWLGIGLDEFGNFSNPSEGRIGGPGFRPDAVAIRGAAPEYRYLEGTGTLSPGIDQPNTANPSPHRYRITVDSRTPDQAFITVERDLTGTGGDYQVLVPSFDALAFSSQPAVPDNFLLSLTGSTGGSNNIHELDNVQLCALKLEPVGAQVDHFEILHDGTALTCQPETLTVRACANADCSELFTDTVEATMTPTGWVGGDTITITGGVTTTAALQKTTAGTVQLDVVGSQPATRPQAVTLCSIGGGPLSAGNCGLSFFESGLAFDLTEVIAGLASGPVEIAAVRQDDNSQACVPAFANVTRTVSFWSDFVAPSGTELSATPPVSVSGTAIGQSQGDATGLSLDFNAEGIARIDLTYPEAGQMQLNAHYVGSAATDDEGLLMPGADQFVSIPAGFCIEATAAEAACDAPLDQCSVLAAAGDPFAMSIRAVGWQAAGETGIGFCSGNPTTRNFRLQDLGLSHTLLAPNPGASGSLAATAVPFTGAEAGVASFNQAFTEVGAFSIQVTAGQSYLGRTLPGGTSASIGRITPAYFAIDTGATNAGTLNASCTAGDPFSYVGEPIAWLSAPAVDIWALNRSGQLTTNYTRGGFQKLAAAGISRSFPNTDDVQLLADGTALTPVDYAAEPASLSGAAGVLQYRFSSTDRISYTKVAAARVAPFTPALTFSLDTIVDTDGVNAPDVPALLEPAAAFDMRYGRLAMENVYGPENVSALTMPFRVEHWNGSRFELNGADSCTGWTTGTISNTANHHSLAAAAGTFVGGVGGPLSLEPNGTQGTDTLQWAVEAWLQDYWQESAGLENPRGLATFGVYRGHDRIIYWRER